MTEEFLRTEVRWKLNDHPENFKTEGQRKVQASWFRKLEVAVAQQRRVTMKILRDQTTTLDCNATEKKLRGTFLLC